MRDFWILEDAKSTMGINDLGTKKWWVTPNSWIFLYVKLIKCH